MRDSLHPRPSALDAAKRFRLFYRTNFWGDPETASGDSSRESRAGVVSSLLAEVVFPERVVLMDLGCGDCNWISQVDLGRSEYIGVDIVPELIELNRKRLGSSSRRFILADARYEWTPPADVILVRDVLPHLTDHDVILMLSTIKQAQPAILIANTFRGASGDRDLTRYNHVPLDLESEQYGLGRADRFMPERILSAGSDEVRGLAIWVINHESSVSRRLIDRLDVSSAGSIRHYNLSARGKVRDKRQETTQVDWSVRVDGRGYAFMRRSPASQNMRLLSDKILVFPCYVPVAHVERRLTKCLPQGANDEIVIGSSCVAYVGVDPSGTFSRDQLVLILPTVDPATGMVGPGVSGDGYLQSWLHIESSSAVPISDLPTPHIWLVVEPLTVAFETLSVVEESLQGSVDRDVHIWGAGTSGLLIAALLVANEYRVSVSDVYPTDSWIGSSVERAGANYIETDFNYTPEVPLGVTIDATSERPMRTRGVTSSPLRLQVGELDHRGIIDGVESVGSKDLLVGAYQRRWLRDAIKMIADSPFDQLWSDAIAQIVPQSDYDAAIFPGEPTRMHIVAIESRHPD